MARALGDIFGLQPLISIPGISATIPPFTPPVSSVVKKNASVVEQSPQMSMVPPKFEEIVVKQRPVVPEASFFRKKEERPVVEKKTAAIPVGETTAPEPYKIYLKGNTYTNIPPYPGAKPVFDFTPPSMKGGGTEKEKALGINWAGIAELFKDPRVDLNFIKFATQLITDVLRLKAQQNIATLRAIQGLASQTSFDDLYRTYSKILSDYNSAVNTYGDISLSANISEDVKNKILERLALSINQLGGLIDKYHELFSKLGLQGQLPVLRPENATTTQSQATIRGVAPRFGYVGALPNP